MDKIKNAFRKVFEFIKKFINKDNFTKTKLVMLIIISGLCAVVLEYSPIMRRFHPEVYISKNRIVLLTLIFIYIGMHFIFKLKEMYEWIHKNRYKIACAFLLFVMVLKLNGTSIVNFNDFIQPNNDSSRYHTILGKARMIRTDEWATSTTYILSQANSTNPFSYYSDILRGTSTDMFTVSNSPVLDIVMLGRPLQVMFMILGNDYGLSFYWYSRIVLMLLGSYELCLILTNRKKRISALGMIMITFSAATQWWYCMDSLIWGQIVMVLIDKFMTTDKKRNKYLCALGILVSGLSYVFIFYPAWQLPFGYVFLALFIWMLFKNIKYGNYKINWHDVLVVAVTLICIVLVLGRWYMMSKDTLVAEMSTDYPGERQEVGGHGSYNLFSYFYDIFLPWYEFLNPCEYASMLSFFPIPILLGLVYVIRNKKDLHFWIPSLIVSIAFGIWVKWGFPAFLANITKLSMSPAGRTAIPLGTMCIYMLIYLMGNIDEKEDKLFNKPLSVIIPLVLGTYIAYRAHKTIGFQDTFLYLDKFKMIVAYIVFMPAFIGLFWIKNEKIRNILIYWIIGIALITGLRVNPVISTTDIFYTKPVSVKLQEIEKEDPDALWLVSDGGWYYNDYALTMGINTLNSTAVYPNFELFEELLDEKSGDQKEIFNRYAHLICNITDKESSIELLFLDTIYMNISVDDLDDLNVKYILSTHDLVDEGFDEFNEIYDEDGMYIYELKTEGNN